MKKLLTTLFTFIYIITALSLTKNNVVFADNYYPMGCANNEFEVSIINDDGSFSKVECHSSYSKAKKLMKKNDDYVIRYSKSYSPTKIIAMNSGVAYSYPGRRNSSIMYLYQNPNDRTNSKYKTTYIANHYEMTYISTRDDLYDLSKTGKGYIQAVMNGFEGFTDLEYTDLVPTKFLEKDIPIWLGGQNTYENEGPFLVRCKQNYYEIVDNDNYVDLVFHFYRAYPNKGNNGNEALSYSYHIDNGQAYLDLGMQKNTKYYSYDGINFFSDSKLTKKVATYYNYYQFLSLRSTTDIKAASFNGFMEKKKGSGSVMANQAETFINRQNKYGCNALLVYAMACLESGYGTSGYARNRNNLFGWSAYDDSPNDASSFSSIDACVKEQMGRNLNWFMDYSNRRYFGSFVGNKGAGFNVAYASDPYWGIKIASIAYSIDKFANNYDGNLTDHNKYNLGLVKNNYNDVLYDKNIEWDPKFYLKSKGKEYLYTARYGSHYQKDLVIILDKQVDNRYLTPSTNPVVNNEINTDDGILKYDWEKSIAYIDIDKVEQINNIETNILDPNIDYEYIVSLRTVKMENDTLSISGIGLFKDVNFDSLDHISHKITLISMKDENVKFEFDADTIDSDGFTYNDEFNYTYAGFNCDIDIKGKDMPLGSYYVVLTTRNHNISMSRYLYSPEIDYRTMVYQNERTYKVYMNDYYNYRFELDILSTPEELEMTKIHKPSARPSSLSFEEINIDDTGVLNIQAHGYMFYVDYENKDNISYEVYLVDDKNNYLKLDTSIVDTDIDYTKELNSKYKLNHITFKATKNVKDLKGSYYIFVKMKNNTDDNYLDVLELSNYGIELENKKIDKKTFTFKTSKLRDRIILDIK